MRAGNICIASAVYRTSCGCAAEVAVERGEPCPPCPDCQQPVDLIFVRSSFVPVAVGDEEGASPESPVAPHGLRGLIRELRTSPGADFPLRPPFRPAAPTGTTPPPSVPQS
jgi:hypothetical protein